MKTMPHKCTKCGREYKDGSTEILRGCASCGGKKFLYVKEAEHATTVLFVLKVGPDAYADKTKFPSGPWCKEGDFIMVRTYAGTRFKIYGNEFRFINDDQVDGIVDDPRGITRA